MDVVVVVEALVLRGCHVRVRLHGVPELLGEGADEVDDRRPHAMQGLQDQRRPVAEEGDELAVADLVRDPGTDAAGPR